MDSGRTVDEILADVQARKDEWEIRDIGESGKVSTMKRDTPLTLGQRAAEMAYRRGFTQGVAEALYLIEGPDWWRLRKRSRLAQFFEKVTEWRMEGNRQRWKRAVPPPQPPTTTTPGVVYLPNPMPTDDRP
jgi:hypothetical protein